MTIRLARACNEYGAKLVQDHPTRFGLLAAMPLPAVDATLREIEHAYDALKVDGVALLKSARRPNGPWLLQSRIPGALLVEMEKPQELLLIT